VLGNLVQKFVKGTLFALAGNVVVAIAAGVGAHQVVGGTEVQWLWALVASTVAGAAAAALRALNWNPSKAGR